MGCDIHFYCEVRKDGRWQSADVWKTDEDGYKRVDRKLYEGRNYSLFAMLANVRNGHGFAGVKTGDGFKPISEPRGLPSDVSPEISDRAKSMGADGHSHSWLTLAELMAYDWHQKTMRCGWVDKENYRRWKTRHKPESWAGDVWGLSVIKLPQAEFDRLYETNALPEGATTHVEWAQYYYECIGDFALTMIRAHNYGKPQDVRFVFFFDN